MQIENPDVKAHRRCGVGPLSLAIVVLVSTSSARAETPTSLTLADVVARARTSAYESQFAALDVEDARAQLAGAQTLIRDNPTISASAGPRLKDPAILDGTASIGVPIELGWRRARAVDLAENELRRDQFHHATAQRAAVREAVGVYLRALYASEQRELANERQHIAEQLVVTAVDREKAGDASRFEVNLARAELARAASQALERESALENARTELARILVMTELGPLAGTLADAGSVENLRGSIGALGAPSLDEARAEVDAAHAAVELAGTAWWPDVSLIGTYALDDGDHTAAAGVAVTIPIFANGEGERRAAAVRVERSRLWSEAARSNVEIERARAAAALDRATAAVRVLAEDGLPRAIENEGLARDAYRAGKLDLSAYVVLRRESLETREEHLARLLEKAMAALAMATAESEHAAEAPQGETR